MTFEALFVGQNLQHAVGRVNDRRSRAAESTHQKKSFRVSLAWPEMGNKPDQDGPASKFTAKRTIHGGKSDDGRYSSVPSGIFVPST